MPSEAVLNFQESLYEADLAMRLERIDQAALNYTRDFAFNGRHNIKSLRDLIAAIHEYEDFIKSS